MKDMRRLYYFVERLQCEFPCILGVRVAQSESEFRTKKHTYFDKTFCKNQQSQVFWDKTGEKKFSKKIT